MPAVDEVARAFWRKHRICGVCEKNLTYRDAHFARHNGVVNMMHDTLCNDKFYEENPGAEAVAPEAIRSGAKFQEPRDYTDPNGLDPLPQIEPQKARNFKDLDPQAADLMWRSDRYWAEWKYDGVRMLCHFTKDGIRMTSRRVSKRTNRYNEPDQNFPHLRNFPFDPRLIGTVLDSEVIIEMDGFDTGAEVCRGYLNATVAVSNAGMEKARWMQERNQCWANCYFFDALRIGGKDITGEPLERRRALLETLYAKVFEGKSQYHFLSQYVRENKKEFYADIVAKGGEGIMLKDSRKPYAISTGRPPHWWKKKKVTTIDAVVMGYIPGKHGYEGLVGALEVGVYNDDGVLRPIASVSQMELVFRQKISHRDEKNELRMDPEMYGRVVEVSFQELTKSERGRHAVLMGFRDDKEAKDCTVDQLTEDA